MFDFVSNADQSVYDVVLVLKLVECIHFVFILKTRFMVNLDSMIQYLALF